MVHNAPRYFDTDQLIKDVAQNTDTMDWTPQQRDLYEETWQNQEGDLLYIEDATQILSPTEQTHLSDFNNERYRVLEQDVYAPESRLKETFADLESAEAYVEENYNINI